MKIVFIINSISAQRCIKRVEEFIDHGFDVAVYGFSRQMEVHRQPEHFSIETIGEYPNSLSFVKRLPILAKGIKHVLNKHWGEKDILFYLFQLDIALVYKICSWGSNRKYIFEESDLMHTYISNKCVRNILEWTDKRIIKESMLSVFTSEGFLKYHYADDYPNNTFLIANKLSLNVVNLKNIPKKKTMEGKLRIGFVGFPRYKSIISFIYFFCKNFPSYEFHVYGEITSKYKLEFEKLRAFPNCYFHGSFVNPNDLPEIYSNIDIVLSTYDVEYENVRYAEPNKIYEAIYFDTPIIVSKCTFLAEKVARLNIGYCVDSLNEHEVVSLIKSITLESLQEVISSCQKIDKKYCLNVNEDFFAGLKGELNIVL